MAGPTRRSLQDLLSRRLSSDGLRYLIAFLVIALSLWIFVGIALLLGGLKARYLFSKSCRKNLARIKTLDQPRIWQFFRPRFFLLLALMILTGAMLSRLAEGHYPSLVGVGALDLSLAIALLGSSIVFWQQRAFAYAPESRPRHLR